MESWTLNIIVTPMKFYKLCFQFLKRLTLIHFSICNTEGSLSKRLINSAYSASLYQNLDEVKANLSKHVSFCNGFTKKDASEYFLKCKWIF